MIGGFVNKIMAKPYFAMHKAQLTTAVRNAIPILGFAKSYKSNGILIPDWTFHNPYKSKIKSNWEKQMKQIMLMSKNVYTELVNQSIIETKEAPSLENLLQNTE